MPRASTIGLGSDVLGRNIQLQCDIAAVEASLDVAVPFGLLVTELIVNCLKHAFKGRSDVGNPGNNSDNISITVLPQGENLCLRVADNGVGLPEGFVLGAAQSMGLQLAASLAMQLGGELQAHNDGGAVFTTTLPRLIV